MTARRGSHPVLQRHELLFCNLIVENPAKSPNTDGLDPESCRDVTICGVRFSLGDDCIAVKSGKIYMGRRYKTPSSNIHVYQCLMEHGHGAVTVGSEMAGGVNNLIVEEMPVLPYRPRSAYQDAQGTRQGCDSGQYYLPGSYDGTGHDAVYSECVLFLRPGRKNRVCAVERTVSGG